MNKYTKSVIVLTSICLVIGALLAITNHFTAPVIENNLNKKANEACFEVMSDGKSFEKIDVENLPKTITAIYQETTGKGYVFNIQTTGFNTGLVIMCGITNEGKITKVISIANQETDGFGKDALNSSDYINQFIGKDKTLDGVSIYTGATVTSKAFQNAINDAFVAFEIIKNGGNN